MCRALPDPSRPRLGGRAACCLSRRPFPRRRSPVKKYIIAVLLGTGAVGAIGAGMLTSAPASAQISVRSEEHTSELQSLMRISYAVFCLKKKNTNNTLTISLNHTQQEQ